jgi:hypothetical protein
LCLWGVMTEGIVQFVEIGTSRINDDKSILIAHAQDFTKDLRVFRSTGSAQTVKMRSAAAGFSTLDKPIVIPGTTLNAYDVGLAP